VCDLETSRICAPYIHDISSLRVKDTCTPVGTRLSLHISCYLLISNEMQLATLATVHTCHHLNTPGAPAGTKLLLYVSWYITISFTNMAANCYQSITVESAKPSITFCICLTLNH